MLSTIPLDYNVDFVMCEGGNQGSKKSQIADIMGYGFLMKSTLVCTMVCALLYGTLFLFYIVILFYIVNAVSKYVRGALLPLHVKPDQVVLFL